MAAGNAYVSSSTPASAEATRPSRSSAASAAATSCGFAEVAGLRGTKSWQQSWSGSVLISNVPMRLASFVISSLSMPTSGRSTGPPAAASITDMLSRVCEATWPRLSPVTRAFAFLRAASASAMRTMKRR